MTFTKYIELRNKGVDEYGEKHCYCGHTDRCTCANPDRYQYWQNIKDNLFKPEEVND